MQFYWFSPCRGHKNPNQHTWCCSCEAVTQRSLNVNISIGETHVYAWNRHNFHTQFTCLTRTTTEVTTFFLVLFRWTVQLGLQRFILLFDVFRTVTQSSWDCEDKTALFPLTDAHTPQTITNLPPLIVPAGVQTLKTYHLGMVCVWFFRAKDLIHTRCFTATISKMTYSYELMAFFTGTCTRRKQLT